MKRKMTIAGLALGALIVVVVLVITIAGGAFMPKRYLEPWNKTYYQEFDDPRMQLVAHGLLAANSHNMQPWKIEFDEADPASFLLFADGDRLTPQVDPPARQFTISQGTFLEYCEVAADRLGYQCAVELFPEGEYDADGSPASMAEKPVARVTLQPTGAAPGSLAGAGTAPGAPGTQTGTPVASDPLYECLFLPDTNRSPYEDVPLAAGQVQALTDALSGYPVDTILLASAEERKHIGDLAIEAAKVEGSVSRISDESGALFRGTEYQKNEHRYGFSVEGQGASGFGRWLLEGLLAIAPSLASAGDSNQRFVDQTTSQVQHTPAYILILTADNSRTSQVKAGMAYARLQLTAQSMGLAVQPLSQMLEEYPEMKTLGEQVHAVCAPKGETIQMLVRVGIPTKDVPRSMRRDATDLIME